MKRNGNLKYLFYVLISLVLHGVFAHGIELLILGREKKNIIEKKSFALNINILDKKRTRVFDKKVKRHDSQSKKSFSKIGINLSSKTSYQKAKLRGTFRPQYPQLSWEQGEEGIVIVSAVIDALGIVKRIELIQSSGFIRLDQSIINSLLKEKFEPAKRRSINIEDTVELKFNFRLN